MASCSATIIVPCVAHFSVLSATQHVIKVHTYLNNIIFKKLQFSCFYIVNTRVKRVILILLLLIVINKSSFPQNSQTKEDCLKNDNAPIVYIPGYKDCFIDSYKNTIFRINPEILKNGFELKINPEFLKKRLELKKTDTSFNIISFVFTFDFSNGITEILSNGNKILPRNDSIISLSKIVEAELITIQNIRIGMGSRIFHIPSLTLYCVKD